jgi:Cupin
VNDPDVAIANLGTAEVRTFPNGRFELCRLGGHVIGRARYQPGWRWSRDIGPQAGTRLCQEAHVGVVTAGQAGVRMADGREFLLRAGDAFVIPGGHDSWVVGDQPYESIHFTGAADYATPRWTGCRRYPASSA